MKQSYFRTPRTIGECTFNASADPFEHYRAGHKYTGIAFWSAIAIGAVAVVLSVALN